MTWKRYQLVIIISFIVLPLLTFLAGYLSSRHWPVKEPSKETKEQLIHIFNSAKNNKTIDIKSSSDLDRNYRITSYNVCYTKLLR